MNADDYVAYYRDQAGSGLPGYAGGAVMYAISDSAPLEFFIAGTGEDYLDLNNTMLFLRLKITRPNGADIADPAPVGLINYAGSTLFSQLDISLDNTAGHMDVRDPVGRNRGLLKRSSFTHGSQAVELLVPIHADIFFQEKLLINGVDVKIRLIRGKDEFCLMRSDDVAYKVKILSASLFVKKVSVSPAVRLGHAQALLSTTAKYPVDRVCLKTISLPAGSRVSNQENLFLGTLPKSIILGMVDNDAFSGSYDKNPFTFNHYDLEFLAIYADGKQIPSKPLQSDFESGSAVREYYQLVMSTGRHLKNHALAIDRDEFQAGYSLFAFNLTPDEECSQHLSLVKSGNIRLEAPSSGVLDF
ncbi:uncharacterized protein F54H12.2-like [Misgurnus anguillicaudatus]|uniref:uncharacterized protein F54H12.2-like n=1 Tax=Misgurnus anguillicaudatus TaxID=75329 RepID=UPI003CCF1B37